MQQAYVRLFFISTLIAIVLGAAANFLIDPYGLHRFIDRDGFNRKKPKSGVNGQLVKPYNVQVVRPRTLVLGNSRVEVGIDPQSMLWPATARPVYNMALPASDISAAVRSLQHVLSVAKPEMVVVGIDFFDFLVDDRQNAAQTRRPIEPTEFDKRLLVNADGSRNDLYPLQRIKDFASALFSLNALADSVQTIALQMRNDQQDLTSRGFNPMREYQRFVRVDGHHTLFRQVDTTYLTNYMRSPKAIYRAGSSTSTELDHLRQLIRMSRAAGIRLILYIHPYHAHMLESYRIAGLWPLFEEWKRAVVRIVDEDAAAWPGAAPVDLWDFSGYNEITTERVPAVGERGKAMQWYWEAGHYKREVGELVLARMLADTRSGGHAPSGFGIKLNRQNLEPHLAATRAGQQAYQGARQDEIAELENLAQSVRSRLKPDHASRQGS